MTLNSYLFKRHVFGDLSHCSRGEGSVLGIGFTADEGNMVSDLKALYIGSDLNNLTRTLTSKDKRKRLGVESGSVIGVDKVDASVGYLDQDLIGLGGGFGDGHVSEDGTVAGLRDLYSVHR